MRFKPIEIKDIIPESYANLLESIFTSTESWVWNDSASGVGKNWDFKNQNICDNPQLTHVLFDNISGQMSNSWHHVSPIFWFLEDKIGIKANELMRIKSNLTFPTPENQMGNYNPPHVDTPDNRFVSMVYYINDSDGDTVIFDKNFDQGYDDLEIAYSSQPKKGKAIIFPSDQFHASSNPTKHKNRIILNFVFAVENLEILN